MEQTELYRQKLTTAAEAVKEVRSGDWVDYGWCTGTPEALDRALAARYEELHDVKVRGGIIFHRPAIMSVPDAPEPLLPLLAMLPMQLLAYHMAVAQGRDVDKPRNLAKSVTVE